MNKRAKEGLAHSPPHSHGHPSREASVFLKMAGVITE